MNAQTSYPTRTPAHPPAWIETVQRAATGKFHADRFCVDGLEITLNAVDPSLVRWVFKYLQPLSLKSSGPKKETCTFYCLHEDDLVVEASRFFNDERNIDFLGRGKDGATLKCAKISDNLTLYSNGSDGIFWLADFAAKTIIMVFSSRTRRPALDFSRMVRDIITSYLTDQGWCLYHAGAVGTDDGVLMIVGNPGAGKTTLILGLVRDGARYMANEQLFVRADGDGFQALGYPMAIAVGLGTALQFQGLADLIEAPDPLLYPRRRFNLSEIKETPREKWPLLDDKLQMLPEEISTYVGPSEIASGGRLVGIVVPRISKTPVTPKIETLDEDTIHDVLVDNLLEPSNGRSSFAWSRMVVQGLRGDDEDGALLERLCRLKALRFRYSLSASDSSAEFANMLLASLSSERQLASNSI